MASEPMRDPAKDHLLTPQNATLIIIETGGTAGIQFSYEKAD